MQSFNEIWDMTIEELKKEFPLTSVDLWFKKLNLCDFNEERAVIICDEVYKYKILNTKYKDAIKKALSNIVGFDVDVVIVDKKSDPEKYAGYVPPENGVVPEPVNLADLSQISESEEEGEFSQKGRQKLQQNQMEYTFDNFIIGSSNKFAHAASVAVANEPACNSDKESYAYNPLFIYGPSGLGKTHLLYAIINHIRKTRPELKIVYVKGEEFTNQLIDSISKKTPGQFREKYRTADVLLIDDIQFIAGRESTQEEFFHTFNALYEDHKQIILTSDRPPKEIQTLEDRLKTRFEWGITADIQLPDTELRAAIIKNKAAAINVDFSNEVINYLADNLRSNIRQLEGAIKKLGALNLLTGTPITVEIAEEAIKDIITDNDNPNSMTDRVLESVAKKFGVTVENLKSPMRNKEIKYPRHIAIYILREYTGLSLPKIGSIFNRDHSTALNSINTVKNELKKKNSSFEMDISDILKELNIPMKKTI